MPRIELVRYLTDPSRYNRHVRPLDGVAPLNVTARSFIYMLQSVEGRLHMVSRFSQTLVEKNEKAPHFN